MALCTFENDQVFCIVFFCPGSGHNHDDAITKMAMKAADKLVPEGTVKLIRTCCNYWNRIPVKNTGRVYTTVKMQCSV